MNSTGSEGLRLLVCIVLPVLFFQSSSAILGFHAKVGMSKVKLIYLLQTRKSGCNKFSCIMFLKQFSTLPCGTQHFWCIQLSLMGYQQRAAPCIYKNWSCQSIVNLCKLLCLHILFMNHIFLYPSKQHLLNRPTAIFLSFQLTVSCRSNTSLVTVSSFCWNFWFSWELRLIKHRRKKKRTENRHNKAVMRRNIWRKKTGGSLWRRVNDIENLNLPISSMKDIKNNICT